MPKVQCLITSSNESTSSSVEEKKMLKELAFPPGSPAGMLCLGLGISGETQTPGPCPYPATSSFRYVSPTLVRSSAFLT